MRSACFADQAHAILSALQEALYLMLQAVERMRISVQLRRLATTTSASPRTGHLTDGHSALAASRGIT